MVCESALVLNNLAIDEGIYGKQYKNMRSVFFFTSDLPRTYKTEESCE